MATALVSPCRIKRNRHRWRRVASGRTVYAYVGGNPISSIDPLGLCPCDKPEAPPGADIDRNIRFSQTLNKNGITPGGMLAFADLVRPGGLWDYKSVEYPKYEAAGNFNYGATGRASGFSAGTLFRMAGAVQTFQGRSPPGSSNALGVSPFGDDFHDQKQIQEGINYYENCRK